MNISENMGTDYPFTYLNKEQVDGSTTQSYSPRPSHHVTQRGNQKANVYRDEQDRKVYSRLLQERSNHYSIDILSYCLMTNHIHLVVVPHRKDSLSRGLRDAHGFYAVYFNRKYNLTGHFWQGRFYSCVLDEVGLWCAVRYVERNPVRAGMVTRAELYRWCSAAAHCGLREDPLLSEWFPPKGPTLNWSAWLASEEAKDELESLREKTKTGRPWGSETFIDQLESKLGRPLKPQKGGRPFSKKLKPKAVNG